MKLRLLCAISLVASATVLLAAPKVVVIHHDNENASADFVFKDVPPLSHQDAATQAKLVIVDGRRDRNGGDLEKLQDGLGPSEGDEPAQSFFFAAGTDGGRLLVDLNQDIELAAVNTYSWHNGDRGPQVYHLYASRGNDTNFNAQPHRGIDPVTCGWTRVAQVDTRPAAGEYGGQYAVSISDSTGSLGQYRYLLLDIFRTESKDTFGNTFYCEIDAIDRLAPPPVTTAKPRPKPAREMVQTDTGAYLITLDTSDTPDLTAWAHQELAPVVRVWYPRIVQMLASEGYEAPPKVTIAFSGKMKGVADTSGSRIRCAAPWFRQNLHGEALGSVVHELVHVVQNYGRSRQTNPHPTSNPGWLVEGMSDYIRWFQFEPQSRGAEVRRLANARHDASYRVTANFLNWVIEHRDRDLIHQLNAVMREGNYREDLWKTWTGRTVQELGEEWKTDLERKLNGQKSAE